MELTVSHNTDDLRIREIKELSPPSHIMREFPCTSDISSVVYAARRAVHDILNGTDDRLVVIIGPCSIHNPAAALEYARRLREARERAARDDAASFVATQGQLPSARLEDALRVLRAHPLGQGRSDLQLFALPLKYENSDGASVRAVAEIRDFTEKEME